MRNKNITIVVDQSVHDIFTTDFETKTGGVQFWAASFNILKLQTLDEIKGVFTKEELMSLADCFNGTMLEPTFTTHNKYLVAQIEDFEKYENGVSRHKADYNKFLEKIKKLTSAQTYFLLVAAKSAIKNSLDNLLKLAK